MNTQSLKHLFKATALAVLISASTISFAQASDEVVAVVGNSVILKSDLAQGMIETQHQLEAQKQTVPPEQHIRVQALEQLIIRAAQLEQVQRYGLKADEKSLNEAVLKIAQQSGATSLEAFQQKLDHMASGTYEAMRQRVSDDLLINRLRQQQVMSRIKVTDQDIDNFLKSPQGQEALGTQVHVLHTRVSGSADHKTLTQVAEKVKAALDQGENLDAILKQYSSNGIQVDGSDMGFRNLADIPSELAARVSNVETGKTTELIAVADGIHVLKVLERKSNTDRALVPQFETRHILIQTSEVVSADTAKQMIDSLANRIKAGEDFAVLASTFSNDTGSARDGGSLGWVSPGMMVPEFDEMMKNIPVGQISAPFKTQFGWHILQVQDTRQQDMTKVYQERMARQILSERQFDTEVDSWLRELRATTYVEIKDPSLDRKKLQQQ